MIPRPNDREVPGERIRAAGYGRVSCVGDDAIVSLRAQRKAIQRFADQHGVEMVVWCIDRGRGGCTLDRPGLQDLLSRARSAERPFDIVFVYAFGRLTRSQETYQALRDQGIQVLSVRESEADGVLSKVRSKVRLMDYVVRLSDDVERKLHSWDVRRGIMARHQSQSS